jgi:hypothetical protein
VHSTQNSSLRVTAKVLVLVSALVSVRAVVVFTVSASVLVLSKSLRNAEFADFLDLYLTDRGIFSLF